MWHGPIRVLSFYVLHETTYQVDGLETHLVLSSHLVWESKHRKRQEQKGNRLHRDVQDVPDKGGLEKMRQGSDDV